MTELQAKETIEKLVTAIIRGAAGCMISRRQAAKAIDVLRDGKSQEEHRAFLNRLALLVGTKAVGLALDFSTETARLEEGS